MSALISYGIGYSANSTAATSVVIQPPPVYASGDLLVMGVIAGGTAATGGVVPSLPSGWTRLSASGATLATFCKTATGSESPYTVHGGVHRRLRGVRRGVSRSLGRQQLLRAQRHQRHLLDGDIPRGGHRRRDRPDGLRGGQQRDQRRIPELQLPLRVDHRCPGVRARRCPRNPDSVQPVAIGLAEVTGTTGNPTLTSTEGCNLYGGFLVLNITGKAPTPYQVTATSQPPAGNVGIALTVKALTGAQPGRERSSPRARRKSFYASGVSQAPQAAITPNATGSVVYGAVTENFGVTGGNTFTANGSTTFSQNVADALSDAIYGTLKSAHHDRVNPGHPRRLSPR